MLKHPMLKRLILLLISLCFISTSALAGTACSTEPQSAQTMHNAFQLAIKTRQALDASGAQVALVARIGQDLTQYNLRYSHMAFVWRDHPQGPWLAVHALNQCGTAQSALFNEGLANFFFDDLFAWDALIITPSPELQTKIVKHISATWVLKSLHEPHYNMVAYPFSTTYQNSNQWVLEVLSSAMTFSVNAAAKPSRKLNQHWLKQAGYKPSILRIPMLQRLAGRMFKASVAFDDHPNGDRMMGKIEVVTVESVAEFVKRIDPQSTAHDLKLKI